MAKATFRLADAANTSVRALFSFETDAPVTDEWLQDLQSHVAANLPESLVWTGVHKFSIQVEEAREVDPLP